VCWLADFVQATRKATVAAACPTIVSIIKLNALRKKVTKWLQTGIEPAIFQLQGRDFNLTATKSWQCLVFTIVIIVWVNSKFWNSIFTQNGIIIKISGPKWITIDIQFA